jgi:hypothetical protein
MEGREIAKSGEGSVGPIWEKFDDEVVPPPPRSIEIIMLRENCDLILGAE